MKHCHDIQKGSNLDLLLRGLIDRQGWLYFLLNAFIGAYNRRTDVMLRIAQTDPRIAAMIRELDSAGGDLDRTVKANQPNTKGDE